MGPGQGLVQKQRGRRRKERTSQVVCPSGAQCSAQASLVAHGAGKSKRRKGNSTLDLPAFLLVAITPRASKPAVEGRDKLAPVDGRVNEIPLRPVASDMLSDIPALLR
jgi:hypothetical protein